MLHTHQIDVRPEPDANLAFVMDVVKWYALLAHYGQSGYRTT